MPVVTFDSNVWRPAGDPDLFPNDQSYKDFCSIRDAIIAGIVRGRLSESMFTLEGIMRNDRMRKLEEYTPKFDIVETIGNDGQVRITMSMGPDLTAHPGNTPYLEKHLQIASNLGFKIMRCPRIAAFINPDVSQENFVQSNNTPNNMNETFDSVTRKIEEMGAGMAWIKLIGSKHAMSNQAWFKGLANAPESESGIIASAVSEWADADTVSAHIAYRNDYLCTRDKGTKNSNSVFSESNRAWLETDYNVRFVTPEALAQLL
ncbi:MAG: hypothetical protein GF388_00140 [Candidatus Aegiribacteria sp.]|nr:hypothetical protein [Candidatus Aegiribacteria sp.]